MASVDSLPGDQRAVLQLVLGRGRSYDEIARLLSINPDAVRERALAALDTLGPQTKVDRESRAQICDYLLGQLPESQHEEVRDRLAESAPDRAWARVVSSELASVASGPLPDIPAETSAARAAHRAPAPPIAAPPAPTEPSDATDEVTSAPEEAAATPAAETKRGRRGRREREPKAPRAAKAPREPKPPREPKAPREPKPPREPKRPREPKPVLSSDGAGSGPRSSRLGGLIVIGVAVVIVVVVLIIVIGSGGSSSPSSSSTTSTAAAAPPATTASTTATTSGTAPATSGTSTSAKVIAQINLTPPPAAAGSKAAGIAEVLKEGSTDGIAIVAQGVAANTTHPANAYAVWLYNSPTDAKILGFVNPGVSSTGKLSTAGGLPANASHYKQLIVTLETAANPKVPGTIILQGTLTGLS